MAYLKPASYKVTRIFWKAATQISGLNQTISNFQCPSQERVTQVLWYLLFQDSFQTSQCKLKEKKKNQNLFKALPRQFWSHLFCFSSFVSHSLPFITTHKVYSSFPNLNSTCWTLKNVTAFSPACISEIFKNNSQPHCLLLDFFLQTILFTRLETHASSLLLLQLLKQLPRRLQSPY